MSLDRQLLMMYSLEFDNLEEAIAAMEVAEDSDLYAEEYAEFEVECNLVVCEEGYNLDVSIYGKGQ